jgi:lipopolysaccharide O-acetyltransferase
MSHIRLGADFHARDFLWLEAVVSYSEGPGGERFDPKLTIGSSARLSDNVHIACLSRVTIGDHLLCGSGILITDHAHGLYGCCEAGAEPSDPAIPPVQRPLTSSAPVVIGNNVWLGDGVAVLAGAEIGDGCVIGANSVVTGRIPARTIAVGSPARPVRRWDEAARAWLPSEESQ